MTRINPNAASPRGSEMSPTYLAPMWNAAYGNERIDNMKRIADGFSVTFTK